MDSSRTANGRAALTDAAPRVAELLDRLVATAGEAVDPTLLAAARTAMFAATGTGMRPQGEPPATVDLGAVQAYAGQFALDVANLTDGQRDGLQQALAHQAFPFVQAIWVFDVVGRLDALLDQVFGASALRAGDPGERFPDCWVGIEALLGAIPALDAVDPVTAELVRLRLAGHHHCRLCQSLRSYTALAAGASDEQFASAVGPLEALEPRHGAALALVDAFAWTPSRLPAHRRNDLLKHFTPAQVVEILLDTVRNAANKMAVAFRADAPHVSEGYEIYDVAPDGTMTYGLTPPPG